MSETSSIKLKRYRLPAGFIRPDYALSWIAFGTALPAGAWGSHLFPGAAQWPFLDGFTLSDALARIVDKSEFLRNPTVERILRDRVHAAKREAAAASDPKPEASIPDQVVWQPIEEASHDELRVEAARWCTELEAAPFPPANVCDALYAASSTLRRSASAGELSVFPNIRLQRRRDEALEWVLGSPLPGPSRVPIAKARFEQPLYFSAAGLVVPGMDVGVISGADLTNSIRVSVFLDAVEVAARWPHPDQDHIWTDAVEQRALTPPPPRDTASRRIGGRPKHQAHEAFWIELARRANTPDGLPEDRSTTFREMMDWLADEFGDNAPSESAVREWLAKFYAK